MYNSFSALVLYNYTHACMHSQTCIYCVAVDSAYTTVIWFIFVSQNFQIIKVYVKKLNLNIVQKHFGTYENIFATKLRLNCCNYGNCLSCPMVDTPLIMSLSVSSVHGPGQSVNRNNHYFC